MGMPIPALNQHNENASRSTSIMDPEFLGVRSFMQEKIYNMLLERFLHPATEVQRRNVMDLAKRLEEGLLKTAPSKEHYMNLDTLESRLTYFLRRSSMNYRNQQHPQPVSSSLTGTNAH